jgi:hypothetical protein
MGAARHSRPAQARVCSRSRSDLAARTPEQELAWGPLAIQGLLRLGSVRGLDPISQLAPPSKSSHGGPLAIQCLLRLGSVRGLDPISQLAPPSKSSHVWGRSPCESSSVNVSRALQVADVEASNGIARRTASLADAALADEQHHHPSQPSDLGLVPRASEHLYLVCGAPVSRVA